MAHDPGHGEHDHDHPHPHEHDHPHEHAHPHDHPHPHEHGGHGHDADHAHPHGGHGDDADHAHEHRHDHLRERDPHTHDDGGHYPHTHEGAPRAPLLAEGEGAGKLLFFDAFSGVAGDMTIAALLDLGVPLLVVERALAALPLEGFHIHRGHIHRSGIVATTFDVHLETSQPERTFREIDGMLAAAPLEARTKGLEQIGRAHV